MKKEVMTDAQVETEIARLLECDAVKLAKREERIKSRRRQYMYGLRCMEKRGKELIAAGYTMENIAERMFGEVEG